MDKKFTVLLIIVFFLIGFGIGKISEKNILQSKFVQTEEGINQIKSQGEIYNPDGIVIEIGNKFLVVETEIQVSTSPLSEEKELKKQNIKININEKTKIFQLEIVEEALLPDELLCEPLRKVFINFEKIKIGDHIFVVSEENTMNKEEITAKEIRMGY